MKKLIFMLVALFATISLSAQTVSSSRWSDNIYVSVGTGASSWLHPIDMGHNGFRDGIHSVSSLRVGKYVTPVVGFELDGEVGMAYHDKFVDHTTVGGNLLFNVNNMVHKYKGQPDKVEVVPFVGIGWRHTYDYITNNISVKTGTQVNFNMGSARKWQINIIPTINYILTDNGFTDGPTGQPNFDSQRAYLNCQVGVTYKLMNSNGSHNFTLCPYTYTSVDYEKLKSLLTETNSMVTKMDKSNKDYETLLMEKQKEIDNLLARDMVVENVVYVNSAVGFEIGKSKVLNVHHATLQTLADAVKNTDTKLTVVGYADAKTGTKARNLKLSQERADNVKNLLVKMGVKPDNINVIAKGDTEQPFSENDTNRAVIFITK